MTIDEMLTEARYQFYARGEQQRVSPSPHDEGADYLHADGQQILRTAAFGEPLSCQHHRSGARSIGAWCDWINSYRETLDQGERQRRLEAWRQAERRANS